MVSLCWKAAPEAPRCEVDKLEEFRQKVASIVASWPSFWNTYAEKVLDICDFGTALVGILGASLNGGTVTVLGSWGPDAAALCPGRVLPLPWKPLPGAALSNLKATSLDAAASRPPGRQPFQEDPVNTPRALTWKSDSQPFLPYEWHQLLGQTRLSETLVLHAQLEPLVLNGRLVGALLVVSYAGVVPHGRELPPAPAPFTSLGTWTGRGGEPDRATGATSAAAAFLRWLRRRPAMAAASGPGTGTGPRKASSAISLPTPGLLRGLAVAVAQSAFGPHLQAVSRVCSASQSLSSACTLYDFSSMLSCTLSEALAADLHVNLAVRVAVVPPLHSQYGYLLPLESSAAVAAASTSSADPRMGISSNDGLVKRATSGIVMSCGLSASARALRISGRAGSFSGHAPLSLSNAMLSAPGGPISKAADTGRAIPFPLPSSLLLQLLRPGAGNRLGNGSIHSGAACQPSGTTVTTLSYHPEDPTLRRIVATPAKVAAAADGAGDVVVSGTAAVTPTRGEYSAAATTALSSMVVANLHAWMQDVERPSSDVALLMMAARGRGGAAGPGRPSQAVAGGGGPLGGGPACLVAVAACVPSRVTAPAAAAATANCSVHAGLAQGKLQDEAWARSLDVSQRRGGIGGGGEIFIHRGAYGNGYGGGSVRYDSGVVGCGPCVALYIMAQERLPTSLLRAVKERAVGLLELLLPACLGVLSNGSLRAEVDLLVPTAAVGCAAPAAPATGFAAASSRRILAAMGSGSGFISPSLAMASATVGTPSVSNSATPLPSTHMSGSQLQFTPLQLQIQMQMAMASQASASGSGHRRVVYGGGDVDEVMLLPSSVRSPLGPVAGSYISTSTRLPSGAVSPVRVPPPAARGSGAAVTVAAAAGCSGGGKGLGTEVGHSGGRGGGGGTRGSDGEATNRIFAMVGQVSELCILSQQRWPDGGGGGGGSSAQTVMGSAPVASTCSAPPVVPTAPPSSQSRTTRGSPGSFGPVSPEDVALMASIDVTGAMDDLVASMRDNLDVWVHSFWEMLRDAQPNKTGHTHGSYADDDLRFLRLYQRLGSGGASSVYAGVLLGMDVAVKVVEPPPEVDMDALANTQPMGTPEASGEAAAGGRSGPMGQCGEGSEEERMAELATAVRQVQMRELVRSARECAVLTTLSHPSIVQVYSYHTRVQVIPGEGPDSLPRLVPVPPGVGGEAQAPLHSVLIMERCDLGSLADALDSGMFKKAIILAANYNNGNTTTAAAATSNSSAISRTAAMAGVGARPQQQPLVNGSCGGFTFLPSSSPWGCGGGTGGSAMRAIYLTLLEVALALRHLHSMNLVHCDVKVANILLRSSASDPRGFTCKLSDFGLVNLMRSDEGEDEMHEQDPGSGREGLVAEGQTAAAGPRSGAAAAGGATLRSGSSRSKPWMRNADAAGTVTHLAPECFEPGRKLNASVDIYAFGIVMWEVFTRKPPYVEFAPDFEALPPKVLDGLRPKFPSHCPPAYRALAQACWCRDPARRPVAASVVNCLQQLLEAGAAQNRPPR